jgi:hypothetical protein
MDTAMKRSELRNVCAGAIQFALVMSAAALWPASARAQVLRSLSPSPATGTDVTWVKCNPNPATEISTSNWLTAAVNNENQQANLNNNGDQTWTFNFASAKTGTDPNLNFTVAKTQSGGTAYYAREDTDAWEPTKGGATMSFVYTAGSGQPPNNLSTGNGGFEWLQVVHSNMNPGGDVGAFAAKVSDGYVWLDDGLTYGDPWYGHLAGDYVNGTRFLDTPYQPFVPGLVDTFQTFVAQDIVNGNSNTVTLYDGVQWGFKDIGNGPAPGSLPVLLAGMASLAPALLRRRRERCRRSLTRMIHECVAGAGG